MPLRFNTLFDSRYVISRYVASGGMAEIYEAQDVVINKPVALKFIKDKYLESLASVEQFKNEGGMYIGILCRCGTVDAHPVRQQSLPEKY